MSILTNDLPDGRQKKEGSATQTAYGEIRRMILQGELPPGEKLKIETLRNLLDTGASPIREALSLLTSDMLVERQDQRGFRAARTSRSNFEEILSLRCTLEDLALRASMARATDAWEEKLVISHHRMVRAQTGRAEDFEVHHQAFHTTLLENCDSPTLLKFCGQLYDLNIRYRYIAGRSLSYERRDVSAEHEDILEAATAGNADLTSERLLNHYRLTGAYLNGLFAGTLAN